MESVRLLISPNARINVGAAISPRRCAPTLLQIRDAAFDADTGQSLLSFFDGGDAHASVHARSEALKSLLLASILPQSISPIDAVVHAVSWGDPDMLRAKMQLSLTGLTSQQWDQWAPALQQALICAMHDRTERALSCISILIDAVCSKGWEGWHEGGMRCVLSCIAILIGAGRCGHYLMVGHWVQARGVLRGLLHCASTLCALASGIVVLMHAVCDFHSRRERRSQA
jgi:hypothetical protein